MAIEDYKSSEISRGVSAEQWELMQKLVVAAVTASKALNPIEQKKLREEMERERRQKKLGVMLGHAEEMQRWTHQNSCTHSRDKSSGEPVPKGTATWTTGGQFHATNQTASLVCLRCGTMWRFKVSEQQREAIEQKGMLGMAPPDLKYCINKDEFITEPPTDPAKKLAELDKAWEAERV